MSDSVYIIPIGTLDPIRPLHLRLLVEAQEAMVNRATTIITYLNRRRNFKFFILEISYIFYRTKVQS